MGRRQKTTPFVALATVVLLWQRHLTGKTDLSLMVTRDGRSVAAQSAIGSFIDDTVLRCASLGTASSFSDAVATVAAAWNWTLARAEQAPLLRLPALRALTRDRATGEWKMCAVVKLARHPETS